MNKWQKLNLLVFSILVFSSAGLVYMLSNINFAGPFGKPWHLLPSVHEDSLSQEYLQQYQILNKTSLKTKFLDSSRTNLFILVDAWGVPIQKSELEKDFFFFASMQHTFALHQRLANRTKHAERVEFRDPPKRSIYLFGGDSLEYNRSALVKEIGFNNTLFCQKCNDSVMITKIDSLLKNDSLQFIAWTTRSSRVGNKEDLRKSLQQLADFASEHENVKIIMQGSHRPILGSRKTKQKYKSHWVPVVILN